MIFNICKKIEQVSPGFSERYLMDPQRFQSELLEYKKYIKAMVELAGFGENSDKFTHDIYEFSTKIAEVSCPSIEKYK